MQPAPQHGLPTKGVQLLESAAFHEAGHAAMIERTGGRATWLELRWSHQRQAWDGGVQPRYVGSNARRRTPDDLSDTAYLKHRVHITSDRVEVGVVNSLAGMLAQVKHATIGNAGPLDFDTHGDLSALLGWLQGVATREVTVSMRGYDTRQIPVESWWFGGKDREQFTTHCHSLQPSNNGSATFLLKTAMVIMNDPRLWERVRRVAEHAIQTQQDGFVHLRRDQLMKLLSDY